MAILVSFIRKEFLHIIRDRRTMMVTILIPLLLLLLFGFAISTEIKNVRMAVVTDRHDDTTRRIIGQLSHNSYFTFAGLSSADQINHLLTRGEIDAALVIRHSASVPEFQIIADASNPPLSQSATAYIESVIAPATTQLVSVRTLYNPQMKSAYNFVPGILGMIFILICAIMTSVSIVSEKESGTLDLLTVSPVRPATIIFGKLIPYFAVSCIILAAMLFIAYTLLGLPFSAGVIWVVAVSLLYIILSLSIGLLVSAIVTNQISALIVSAVIFMIPVIMLSGMIFPIDNMPRILQGVSCIIPARWYISAMRKLMVQQLPLSYVMTEIAILAAMTALILTIAVRKFKASITQ